MHHLKIFTTLLISLLITSPLSAIEPPLTTVLLDQNPPKSARKLTELGAEYLATGNPTLALENWNKAHNIYNTLNDKEGMIGTQINQAQAFQSLGFYRQALSILQSVKTKLQVEPNSSLKVRGLLGLGNTLISLRLLDPKSKNATPGIDLNAKEILNQALKIAIEIDDLSSVDHINLSLGNTFQLLNVKPAAIAKYQAVRDATTSSLLKVQAQINLHRLDSSRNPNLLAFISNIRKDLDSIDPSHHTIHTYVNLARIIQKDRSDSFKDRELLIQLSSLLTTAIGQARTIKDIRGEAQAIGSLGSLYQLTGQKKEAEKLTKQALIIAESLPAPDIAYRLQWQLGKILTITHPENYTDAIAAYSQAVNHLKSLRNDLNGSDADLQFSFRDSIEPVYRELVNLLLKDNDNISAKNLSIARDLIESLQVAELENFLRQGCLDTYKVELTKIDRSATIIYPIILPDRVAIIASIPGQTLRYYSQSIPEANVTKIAEELRDRLDNPEFDSQSEQDFQIHSKQIYDLVIAPLAIDLKHSKSKTLVFVLDGVLRNIPMSMLYDGNNYLVEKYNLALTPGLTLVPPHNYLADDDNRRQYQALLGGISEERQGFRSLDGVQRELDFISNLIPSQKLLNAEFNRSQFSAKLAVDRSSIVHLATHGEFSSNPEQTFILTWDNRLDLSQLDRLLQTRNSQPDRAIDLLVLSACETANGDRRATLGLAGVAIRTRTKSTIASLWKVNDKATQLLMTNLYQNLVTKKLGKAESLKLAQQSLLNNPQYHSPYYWAPFVLVGNWQ